MSNLKPADKLFLEQVFNMKTGYVLDFSNNTFSNFFAGYDIDIDIENRDIEPDQTPLSKANRLRGFWSDASDEQVSVTLSGLADYIESRKLDLDSRIDPSIERLNSGHINKIRQIAVELLSKKQTGNDWRSRENRPGATTAAIVYSNKIEIEIHPEIYGHIKRYLETGDYFHAVEESYKFVRAKLRDMTGSEKAHEAFSESNYAKIFGHLPSADAEKDFFEGVKFLNMSIQKLRNEKAHTPANEVERNLAIHYISLSSLAYDLITRNS